MFDLEITNPETYLYVLCGLSVLFAVLSLIFKKTLSKVFAWNTPVFFSMSVFLLFLTLKAVYAGEVGESTAHFAKVALGLSALLPAVLYHVKTAFSKDNPHFCHVNIILHSLSVFYMLLCGFSLSVCFLIFLSSATLYAILSYIVYERKLRKSSFEEARHDV